ncbi:MAG: UDP-N-acetylmuramoyl-L-alanine--D-glutamate ligase [Clostridiaceae bacterium]|nr:UDP-N-acetylmuramoyl-L-alanine--D-glutamate ligase [Clostridiaceae bacterium]
MLNEYMKSIKNKKVTVIGIGVSNTPLIKLLANGGVDVTAHDKKPRDQMPELAQELENLGVKLVLGPDYLKEASGDIIFRTPGLRPDVPALVDAQKRGAEITSEMEVFLSLCPATVIAVTGSDGKTTTTTIISELLKAQGYRVFVGGNIGNPLLDRTDEMTKDDFCVLELSSFQLLTMKQSPHVAVLTNLSPNHLDVHKDMEEYIDAKKNIFRYQSNNDVLVTNLDNELAKDAANDAIGTVRFFSRQNEAYSRCLPAGDIVTGGNKVMNSDAIRLPGVHNIENYLAAFAATADYVTPQTMAQVAESFGGVEHRLEFIRELDGVRYYNDSIGTSPTRTIAGLRSFNQKVILIAGGYDKHIPFDVLGPEIIEHVNMLFLCGATEEKIYQVVVNSPGYSSDILPIYFHKDYETMLKDIKSKAQPGDIVLFSPACAAFDRFQNFMKRGEYFKKLVNEL